MGMRTAILVKRNFADGTKDINLIHHQWGFAKVMPCLFMQQYLALDYSLDRSIHKGGLKQNDYFGFRPLSSPTNNYIYDSKNVQSGCFELEEAQPVNPDMDIWNIEIIKELFNKTDNNNGGMIIEITEGEAEIYSTNIDNIKIGFVLGYSETDDAFEKIVSAREYMKTTGGDEYCPEEFIKCFELFLEYFEIEQITTEQEDN